MDENVRLQRAHEKQRCSAGLADSDHAGLAGPAEVLGHHLQSTARRRVGIAWIERENDRGLGLRKHVHRQVLGNGLLHEGHELLRQPSQYDARIGGRVDRRQIDDEFRDSDARGPHGLSEERVLARNMTQDRGGSDLQLLRDVRKRCSLEAFTGEDPLRGFQELLVLDDGRPSHL